MGAICPKCLSDLNTIDYEGVTVDLCPGCRGVWLDPGELAFLRGADEDLPASPLGLATGLRYQQTRSYICPRCEGSFETFEFAPGTGVYIDRCTSCRGIWLDAGELQKIRAITDRQRMVSLRRMREGDGTLQREVRRARGKARHLGGGDSSRGIYLFQLLTGLPMEADRRARRVPWVTFGLIASCVLIYFWQLAAMEAGAEMEFFKRTAFVPANLPAPEGWLGMLRAMFMHGGVFHLLGNMYFLWLFGESVEDCTPRGLYLGLYLLTGFLAFAAHIPSADPHIPTLGASGAVSGVMGAYLILFPRHQMYQVLWFIQFRVSAILYMGIWFLMQLAFSLGDDGGDGVAWMAHIGGFLAGMGLAYVLKRAGMLRAGADPSPS